MKQEKPQFKIAILQINAASNKAENLVLVKKLLEEAMQEKPDLICLPEVFNLRAKKNQSIEEAEDIESGESTQVLKDFARENQVYISNGSIFEKASGGLPYNTSILIDKSGEVFARYRKNYLFKARFGNHDVDESLKSQACNKNCLAFITKNGFELRLGLSICYDLRFPEFYRQYAREKTHVLLVPSSFAKKTGEAHWEPLLRARAIENQAYVVAANQWGKVNELETYGNSMIIDPWGKVIARANQNKNEIITACVDIDYLNKLRESLPVLDDIKLD